ncbi:hypothetical protein MMC30_001217 [Trapelia coarctata]|nr:hypothetical protein [Trapelia coarctata]
MSSMETSEVIIVGCGPTGAVLSAHLSRQRVRAVILEREPTIPTDPRGIALDEEGIRTLQGLGLYDKVYTEIGRPMGIFNFISGSGGLQTRPFLRLDYNTIVGGTGHVGVLCHKQPAMEKCIRSVIDPDIVSLRSGCTVTAIDEDQDWVYTDYTNPEGQKCRVRSKFLVGADGKTGFTRKRYLEPKGIHMERDLRLHYEETWIALNWHLVLPTPESHPKFPLWKFGYTPEGIYDIFFPKDFRFLCNPNRPAICTRFGLEKDRLWRFEFVVKPGEDNLEMASTEKTREIIMPYLTHPGSQYGLAEDISWPLDCIKCLRSSPFFFSARSCNKWALGRTILCGDAAHVFPPFGGQGIVSGFRDAISLSWRLALALGPSAPSYEGLLTGWYTERKQQLERSLAITVRNGNFCTEPSRVKAFIRDWYLWFIQLVPSWRHQLELGGRGGMIQYDYRPGMPFLEQFEGGRMFPQVFCAPVGELAPPMPMFTDDIIFSKEKKCLFQLVVIVESVAEIGRLKADLADIDTLSEGELDAEEATFILHDFSYLKASVSSASFQAGPKSNLEDGDIATIPRYITRTVTSGEYAATTDHHPDYAIHRPPPLRYNHERIRNDIGKDKKFVILRPDWFVFAACRDKGELEKAAGSIKRVLHGVGEGVEQERERFLKRESRL